MPSFMSTAWASVKDVSRMMAGESSARAPLERVIDAFENVNTNSVKDFLTTLPLIGNGMSKLLSFGSPGSTTASTGRSLLSGGQTALIDPSTLRMVGERVSNSRRGTNPPSPYSPHLDETPPPPVALLDPFDRRNSNKELPLPPSLLPEVPEKQSAQAPSLPVITPVQPAVLRSPRESILRTPPATTSSRDTSFLPADEALPTSTTDTPAIHDAKVGDVLSESPYSKPSDTLPPSLPPLEIANPWSSQQPQTVVPLPDPSPEPVKPVEEVSTLIPSQDSPFIENKEQELESKPLTTNDSLPLDTSPVPSSSPDSSENPLASSPVEVPSLPSISPNKDVEATPPLVHSDSETPTSPMSPIDALVSPIDIEPRPYVVESANSDSDISLLPPLDEVALKSEPPLQAPSSEDIFANSSTQGGEEQLLEEPIPAEIAPDRSLRELVAALEEAPSSSLSPPTDITAEPQTVQEEVVTPASDSTGDKNLAVSADKTSDDTPSPVSATPEPITPPEAAPRDEDVGSESISTQAPAPSSRPASIRTISNPSVKKIWNRLNPKTSKSSLDKLAAANESSTPSPAQAAASAAPAPKKTVLARGMFSRNSTPAATSSKPTAPKTPIEKPKVPVLARVASFSRSANSNSPTTPPSTSPPKPSTLSRTSPVTPVSKTPGVPRPSSIARPVSPTSSLSSSASSPPRPSSIKRTMSISKPAANNSPTPSTSVPKPSPLSRMLPSNKKVTPTLTTAAAATPASTGKPTPTRTVRGLWNPGNARRNSTMQQP